MWGAAARILVKLPRWRREESVAFGPLGDGDLPGDPFEAGVARNRHAATVSRLPGRFHLLWMLIMQPVTLARRLNTLGVPEPRLPGRILRAGSTVDRPTLAGTYADRIHRALAEVIVGSTLLVGWTLALGIPAWSFFAALGIGALGGLLWAVGFGVAGGVAGGLTAGVLAGVGWALQPADLDPVGKATVWCAVIGGTLGCSGAATRRARPWEAWPWPGALAVAGVLGLVLGGIAAVAVGPTAAIGIAAWTALAAATGLVRVPLWPVEAGLSGLAFLAHRWRPERALGWQPLAFHDLSYLPHPWLVPHLRTALRSGPSEAFLALWKRCSVSPGQARLAASLVPEVEERILERWGETDPAGRRLRLLLLVEARRLGSTCAPPPSAHAATTLDLAGEDLTAADLSGLDLRNVDFSGAILDGADFAGADLAGADLRGASLLGARLAGCKVEEVADLVGAKIDLATVKRSGWDTDEGRLLSLRDRAAEFLELETFPAALQEQLRASQVGLTLYFDAPRDFEDAKVLQRLVDKLPGGHDCRVVEFRTAGSTTRIRLQATDIRDLEAVAEALRLVASWRPSRAGDDPVLDGSLVAPGGNDDLAEVTRRLLNLVASLQRVILVHTLPTEGRPPRPTLLPVPRDGPVPALVDFLAGHFTSPELHDLALRVEQGLPIDLPDRRTAPRVVAGELAGLLVRKNLVDARLFTRLRGLRPRCAVDLDALEALWLAPPGAAEGTG